MELHMRFSSFSNTTPTPIKLNPPLNSFQPLYPISPSSSQRRLLFDDINLNEPTNISASKQLSLNNPFQNSYQANSFSYEKEFCRQGDHETVESNSFSWPLLSDRKSHRSKEAMEVEGAPRTPFAKLVGSENRFTLSRSPPPKKKHIMDSPFTKNLERDILQTPIKDRFKTEVKEKNSYPDFFSFTTRKTVETIARLNNDYEIIEVIGKGSFGKVYRCRHKLDKNEYAVKETLRKFIGKYRASGLNEIQAMASLTAIEENTNVVRYYNSWVEDEKLYLVMEYCPMSLKEQITEKGHFSEAELKKILRDICLGLNYLHRNDIVHLDVKPENILISKTRAYKLGDMGQSAIARLSSDDVEEGDARYLAPELLNPGEFGEKSDLTKADVFSLGMTLFELATGFKIPTNGNEWQDLRNEKFYQLDMIDYLSPSFKKLVKLMMQRNPAQRPSAKELLTHFLPDKVNLELKWEKIEKNMLKDEKKVLESKLLQLNKRRKSL